MENKRGEIEEKRTVGIEVVGIIFLSLGLISYLPAGVMILGGPVPEGAIKKFLDISLRLFVIGVPVAETVSGVGILSYKNWGRILGIIMGIIFSLALFVGGVYTLKLLFSSEELSFSGKIFDIVCAIFCFVGSLLFVLVTSYLMRPKVKEQFSR